MIGIQLEGRLGNQMFQYAAAKVLSERLGCRLLIAGKTPTRRFSLTARLLHLDRSAPHFALRQNGLVYEAFRCGPPFVIGRALELFSPWLRKRYFPYSFRPRTVTIEGEDFEEWDDRLFAQKPGTWLNGLFQSPRYFQGHEDRIRTWFRPAPPAAQRVSLLVQQWPKPPESMAALHIRRGDYARSTGPLSKSNIGWMLPLSYYREAIKDIPKNVGFAIFSDDPDWVEEQFKDLRPWTFRGNSAVVDMMLMARCRWIVTANSSFSWWAGWLNKDPAKTIIAPEFHLGFRLGRWLPGGIAVDGWRYLRVRS